MFSSEGEALIPGAGSLRRRCVSLMILRGRLLFAIGLEVGVSELFQEEGLKAADAALAEKK